MSPHRRLIAVTELDAPIEELAGTASHKTLGAWAAECAERVLPLFEAHRPDDPRPRQAIVWVREWIRSGTFTMARVRKASLDAHAAARECTDFAARAAARAAGQAAATPHVSRHALGSGTYGTTAVLEATGSMQRALEERQWQMARLRELVAGTAA